MRIALAAFAGVAAAWLIPRGADVPAPAPTGSPSDRPGLTAAQIPLAEVREGVTFRLLDDVRVLLVRTGDDVTAFHGRSTAADGAPVWWCERNGWFEGAGPGPYYGRDGAVARFSAPRDLERVRVLVSAGTVTVFPHDISPGPAASPTPDTVRLPRPPAPCSASERVG